MTSMTGYGRASAREGRRELTVEVSSVNKRNLDMVISLPREWQELEASVAERVRRVARRGRISVRVESRPVVQGGTVWDGGAVAEMLRGLKELARQNDVPFEPDLRLLHRLAAQSSDLPVAPGAEGAWERLLPVLEEALEAFHAARKREGESLASDLKQRADELVKRVAAIREEAPRVAPRYRELLQQRLVQAGLELDPDDERVLREIALCADRCDISEELTRLDGHLGQLAGWLRETEGAIGRKTEFLVQEIHRELNTIGSKAGNLRISRDVIEAKNELERVREQIQNIE